MPNHPTAPALQTTAISDIDDIRRARPFRGDFLRCEKATHAAHALDIIEKQTGFAEELDQMLAALEAHAEGRIRWARIKGHREDFIIFRDLSMLTYRSPLIPEAFMEGEIEELLEVQEEAMGRIRDYPEDEMAQDLLPVALTLDLGHHPSEPTDVILRAVVDHSQEGGHSLKLIQRVRTVETELSRDVRLDEIDGPLRKALEHAEEMIEHARASTLDLPVIRRPTPEGMQQVSIEEFEASGLWQDGETSYYWPPYLSHPLTNGEDTEEVVDILKGMGELALWACPDLPETMTLELISPVAYEGQPSFQTTLPRHPDGSKRLAQQALDLLLLDFLDYCDMAHPDLPVGHRTGIKSARSEGVVGLPVAKIEVSRPSARRACELHQEVPHSFNRTAGWIEPEDAVAREEMLLSDPHPLNFDLIDKEGEGVLVNAGDEGQDIDDLASYNMAVAGGTNASLMTSLVTRSVGLEDMDQYCERPHGDEDSFEYSLVVADAFDRHLRRPIGYATLSGTLCAKAEDQVGGEINGNAITTYRLTVYLDRLALAEGRPADDRAKLLSATVQALGSLITRMAAQGEAQGRHFEIDLEIGRETEAWYSAPITADDMAYLMETMGSLRALLARSEACSFISLGDISRACEEAWAA